MAASGARLHDGHLLGAEAVEPIDDPVNQPVGRRYPLREEAYFPLPMRYTGGRPVETRRNRGGEVAQ